MPVQPRRLALHAVALTALAGALATSPAGAASRAPIRDCGDANSSGAGAYAITAQGRDLRCTTAVAVASAVAAKRGCSNQTIDSCTLRGFTCLVGQVGKELYLASCQNSRATKFVRFEFGS